MSQNASPRLSRRTLITAAAGLGSLYAQRPWLVSAQATPDQRPEAQGSAIVAVSPALGLQYTQPAVAVDPRNGQRLLAVARKTAPSPKQPPIVAAFTSDDGGQTWQAAGPLTLPAGLTVGTDATVAFDGGGVGYVAALAAADPAMTTSRVAVWRTDDGGGSFGTTVTVVERQGIAHPWLAADPSTSGHLSVTWTSQTSGLMVSTSTDGGQTFAPPRAIVSAAAGAFTSPVIAAAANSLVAIAYGIATPTAHPATPNSGAPSDLTPISLGVVRSTDGGANFGSPVIIGSMAPAVAPGPEFRVQSGPAIAIDAAGQRVYVAAASFDPISGQSAIQVAGSAAGGASFGSLVPATGDAPPAGTIYAQPSIVVDDAGGINVTYIAVDAAQPQVVYDVFLTRSTDRGATFGHRQRLSDRSRGFAVEGTDANGLYRWLGGAYQGLATGAGSIHPMWSDPVTGIITTTKRVASE